MKNSNARALSKLKRARENPFGFSMREKSKDFSQSLSICEKKIQSQKFLATVEILKISTAREIL